MQNIWGTIIKFTLKENFSLDFNPANRKSVWIKNKSKKESSYNLGFGQSKLATLYVFLKSIDKKLKKVKLAEEKSIK